MRWKRVIGAPESVVGTAATEPPSAPAIAFADVDHAAAAERDQRHAAHVVTNGGGRLGNGPARDVCDLRRILGELRARLACARSVVSSA